tara:strand:+ start:6 stop:464 length:459 start_codon:yes stop_codon:yes gene_type:complete
MNLKFLPFFIIFIFFQGCGYQPILSEKNQKFSINNFLITGDKKLGQTLANKIYRVEGAENILEVGIFATKKREVSAKSAKGSVKEYNLAIKFQIDVFTEANEKVFSKLFSQHQTLKASTLHVDTLNREKKIINDMVNEIREELLLQLNLIYS